MNKKLADLIRDMAYAAVCLALCLALPFLTGQIPEVGNMLCPMHLPVLLAGFLCGPWWGAVVGAIAPVYRYFLFGMPPIFPTGFAMCFELAVYGLVSGWLYRRLPEKRRSVYISLVAAMAAGRIVWGLVMMMVAAGGAAEFTWAVFLSGALLNAIPGIVLQLVLIPVLVLVLRKSGILRR